MIQKIDLEREIGIEMIGARELWIGAVYRYRPRGRVDSERERESFIRKYEKEKWVHRERERESFIKINEKEKWVHKERERERERERDLYQNK